VTRPPGSEQLTGRRDPFSRMGPRPLSLLEILIESIRSAPIVAYPYIIPVFEFCPNSRSLGRNAKDHRDRDYKAQVLRPKGTSTRIPTLLSTWEERPKFPCS
jgi:hypothetical protein